MNAEGLWYFQLLKQEIASVFQDGHPDCNRPFEAWSGQDIADFQQALGMTVKGRISEKWFYTHLKNPKPGKLPRIDVLNLLSEYAGYSGWEDFQGKKGAPNQNEVKKIRDGSAGKSTRPLFRRWLPALGVLSVGVLAALYLYNMNNETCGHYRFCFADADNDMPLAYSNIQLLILRKGESPVSATCDSSGCFEINGTERKITFVVRAPYYKTDTVTRNINEGEKEESVKLRTDDYALMIHVFSKSKVEDWEKRRKQLDNMLAENVQVIQVSGTGERGMELYNKEEFIDKLTMPIGSLRNIEVLETQYQNNQISWIRFKQTERLER